MLIKIAHVITDLNTGGAEMMLYKLLHGTDKNKFQSCVISMRDMGTIGDKIKALDIPVYCLHMRRGILSLRGIVKYFKVLKAIKPDVVQTWMYHANLLASVGYFYKIPTLWNIRQTLYCLEREKRMTRGVIKFNAWLSKTPQAIINNSRTSIEQHQAYGFTKSFSLIPNGFDITQFKPSKTLYNTVRQKLGIGPEVKLVGLFARYHPMKNHAGFLQAAKLIATKSNQISFLIAGRQCTDDNAALLAEIRRLNLHDKVYLLGEVASQEYMPALDVFVSTSSWGEGFSNVLGEALACEVPCVATDIGECKLIIKDCGHIVPGEDMRQLADKVLQILSLSPEEYQQLQRRSRQKIIENYSLDKIVLQYENLYSQVAKKI